jgi:hypothetical protein
MNKEEYPFHAGDIVKCNYDFIKERNQYKLAYPRKGQYLTVSDCLESQGIFALFFDDLRLSIPLTSYRFDLVQTERDGDGILNDAYKIANNL